MSESPPARQPLLLAQRRGGWRLNSCRPAPQALPGGNQRRSAASDALRQVRALPQAGWQHCCAGHAVYCTWQMVPPASCHCHCHLQIQFNRRGGLPSCPQLLVGRLRMSCGSALPGFERGACARSPRLQLKPAQCTAPPGQWVLVPFSATFDLYRCE